MCIRSVERNSQEDHATLSRLLPDTFEIRKMNGVYPSVGMVGMMINFGCQLDWINKQTPGIIESCLWVELRGEEQTEYGQLHSTGWGPEPRERKKEKAS